VSVPVLCRNEFPTHQTTNCLVVYGERHHEHVLVAVNRNAGLHVGFMERIHSANYSYNLARKIRYVSPLSCIKLVALSWVVVINVRFFHSDYCCIVSGSWIYTMFCHQLQSFSRNFLLILHIWANQRLRTGGAHSVTLSAAEGRTCRHTSHAQLFI
jgi:hypothetical protein